MCTQDHCAVFQHNAHLGPRVRRAALFRNESGWIRTTRSSATHESTALFDKLTQLVAGYFEIQCQSAPKWATIFAGALSLFLTIPSGEKALSFLNAAQDSSNGPTCGSGNASFSISQTVSGLPFCFEG